MSPDMHAALSAIDDAIGDKSGGGCQQCAGPLGVSPSAEFCSEDCQQAWHEARAGTHPTGNGAMPDESLPEVAPARPLGWLGQPPAEAFVRAGHEVLDAVTEFVSRYSVFPDEHCAPTTLEEAA